MKYKLKRLDRGTKKLYLFLVNVLLVFAWLRRNAAQVVSILVGIGLLPVAIRLERVGHWLAVFIGFYIVFLAADLLKRPAAPIEHTGNTQPLR